MEVKELYCIPLY